MASSFSANICATAGVQISGVEFGTFSVVFRTDSSDFNTSICVGEECWTFRDLDLGVGYNYMHFVMFTDVWVTMLDEPNVLC